MLCNTRPNIARESAAPAEGDVEAAVDVGEGASDLLLRPPPPPPEPVDVVRAHLGAGHRPSIRTDDVTVDGELATPTPPPPPGTSSVNPPDPAAFSGIGNLPRVGDLSRAEGSRTGVTPASPPHGLDAGPAAIPSRDASRARAAPRRPRSCTGGSSEQRACAEARRAPAALGACHRFAPPRPALVLRAGAHGRAHCEGRREDRARRVRAAAALPARARPGEPGRRSRCAGPLVDLGSHLAVSAAEWPPARGFWIH